MSGEGLVEGAPISARRRLAWYDAEDWLEARRGSPVDLRPFIGIDPALAADVTSIWQVHWGEPAVRMVPVHDDAPLGFFGLARRYCYRLEGRLENRLEGLLGLWDRVRDAWDVLRGKRWAVGPED